MRRVGKGRPMLLLAMVLAAWSAMRADDGPRQVLVEILMASKPEEVEKHLPVEVVEGIKTLSAAARRQCEQKILVGDVWRAEGQQVREPNDGQALMVFEKDGEQAAIRVEQEVMGGGDAMLRLAVERNHEAGGKALVWLHMEDGEWRVTEVQFLYHTRDVVLDDSFVEPFRNVERKEEESVVTNTLYTVNWAVIAYAGRNPDTGFPSDLSQVSAASHSGGDDQEDNTPGASPYLDESMAKNDFATDGYVFHYELRASGRDGAYVLTARPKSYASGRRSFYMDQTGVMRATGEDREATAEDAPAEDAPAE